MKVKQKKQRINRRYQNEYDLLERSNYLPPPPPPPPPLSSYPGKLYFLKYMCKCFKL